MECQVCELGKRVKVRGGQGAIGNGVRVEIETREVREGQEMRVELCQGVRAHVDGLEVAVGRPWAQVIEVSGVEMVVRLLEASRASRTFTLATVNT
ncbi:hypothetical protein PsorP6_007951 [Peronosclerospora sorghi]|uniref:Uncharacterized protein n=1 Tax=Peronosclerospora sorghi TaxID=230839 RepID=A0ACC0WAY1_9STRA|nr:hypothetical protein PsorP6_007951 [Peronosclerospora sorghi]